MTFSGGFKMCGNPFKKVSTPKIVTQEVKAPEPTPTAPTMTEINAQEEGTALSEEVAKNKKKRGYASTRTSTQNTIAGSAQGGKTTLG